MSHKIQIKDINKNDKAYLNKLCEENNCEFEERWQSKYNSYVAYDYEPFCTMGFQLDVYIKGKDFCKIKFIEYLYNKRVEAIDKISKCYNNEVKI